MISTITENESFNDGCILNVRSLKKYRKRETAEKHQRKNRETTNNKNKNTNRKFHRNTYSSSEHCFYQLERSKRCYFKMARIIKQ